MSVTCLTPDKLDASGNVIEQGGMLKFELPAGSGRNATIKAPDSACGLDEVEITQGEDRSEGAARVIEAQNSALGSVLTGFSNLIKLLVGGG